jgi:hypothetical protein
MGRRAMLVWIMLSATGQTQCARGEAISIRVHWIVVAIVVDNTRIDC